MIIGIIAGLTLVSPLLHDFFLEKDGSYAKKLFQVF